MVIRQSAKQRAAQVAAMRAAQERAAKRRERGIIAAVTGLGLLLVGGAGWVIAREAQSQSQLEAAAGAPIEGVREYEGLSQDHVSGTVSYEQDPPVGGDHAGTWTNCGVYQSPLPAEETVHALEHGAVWISYRPDLPEEQLLALQDTVSDQPYTLMSPDPDLSDPVVLSAWGVQLAVAEATDERVELFVQKYQQGEQTPEPGAPCTGGVTPA
ncbi:membrane protein [Cellulomonas marina]|uniref:DUF3105 domain-containing protein n=2 Tax=Cellulomonadaceae TaxID=85016 RepID=A0A1I0Z0A0_9CELL|nr:membrane protein [Cellulomonas marina]SFB17878.1 Protein of unknown function [Cellulomonas marina]